jgi:putative salt-induced outer membrane protein YdiY
MKIFKNAFVLIIILLVLLSQTAIGGELLLTNGDRLTGKVEKIEEGKLYFLSDMAGSVTIDMANVKTFTTDEPVKLVLADGTVVNQQISGSEAGQVELASGPIIKAQKVKIADITAINPPEKQPPNWEGSVSAGLTSVHGNTKSETIQASMNASLRREKDRTTLGADYGRAKQKDPGTGEENTTEDWWKTRAKYDYFFNEKLYGFLEGRYEKDKIAELDRRVIVGAGCGYQWIESDDMNFSTEIGVAHVSEKFEDSTSDKDEMSAQLGYHFDTRITDGIKFINDLTYYPSFGKFSDYYLTTTAEIRASIYENMFTNFKAIFDYDATPAQGKGSTDVKYIIGVGWEF